MIADESAQDVDDVAREIDQHGEQRAELNDGDGRRRLLGLQCLVDAAVKINDAAAKTRCAVELTGMNSVRPWTMPRTIA